MSRSRLFHHLFLLLAAVAVFLIAAWVGMGAIEPVPEPPVPPAKTAVSFDPRVDVRSHPLFGSLQAFFRGKVTPTAFGRANPFLGSAGGAEQLQEGAKVLGRIQEVSLGGAALVALSKGPEHGVVALLQGSGDAVFEVRRFRGEQPEERVGRWDAASDQPELRPIAIQEDRTGRVWFVSAGGRIGSLQTNGRPLWGSVPLEGIQTSLNPAQVAMALDGAGRIWLTDGQSVFVGNGIGFERVDISAQLSSAHRDALGVAPEGDLPLVVRRPERLQMLADGRMAVLTSRFMAIFPLNLQGGAEVLVATGDTVAVEPSGALWSVVRAGSGGVQRWVRTVRDGSRDFTNTTTLPKQAADEPSLASVNTGTLFALDYAPGATILWNVLEGAWVANVLSPEGSQPQDRVERLVADRDGFVWGALAQKGLLLITPSR